MQVTDMQIGPRHICHNPVFVLGAPRSGTTVLAWALAQHSQMWTSGESYIVYDLFSNGRPENAFERALELSEGSWLKSQHVEKEEFLASLGLGINALFSSRADGKRWIDHTPHYALLRETLAHLFPGALFLHIVRDGRKVVHSMINFLSRFDDQSKVAEMIRNGSVAPWATDFREACRTWRVYSEAAMALSDAMPGRVLTVDNEKLVSDPVVGFRHILSFLGAPYEEAPANYFKSHRLNSSFASNVNASVSIGSFPDPWDQWSVDQRMIFMGEAGSTMLKYGFVREQELCLSTDDAYGQLVVRIARLIEAMTPLNATISIISKGDDRLLNVYGRRAWHFPQDVAGTFAGHYPADSDEAIASLEEVCNKGAEFLAIPQPGFWWLNHYEGFRNHLEMHHQKVLQDESCIIYHVARKSVSKEIERCTL